MDAIEAFQKFVGTALRPERAQRYAGLAGNDKGRSKLLNALDHDFEKAMRSEAKRGNIDRKKSCYAFHHSVGFGAVFSSVADALNNLGGDEGWLIITSDGNAGIHRPEARGNGQVEIVS